LNHRFIREARGTQNLVHLIKRYEGWVALGEEEAYEDQPQPGDEYPPLLSHTVDDSMSEDSNEMWDFGTIRPAYSRSATRPCPTNASGTMRVVHSGREPLQPLPAVQRPLTPPESQRQPPKYGGMAQPPSPRKDLQVCTREEMDLFNSVDTEYYDVEEGDDDSDVVSTSTVKIAERPMAGLDSRWQTSSNVAEGKSASPAKSALPPKSPSPSRAVSHVRTSSQIPTPVQSQYTNTKSDVSGFPIRTSAASSTAYAPTSSSVVQAFGPSNVPSRTQLYKYNALEDILLPALEEVAPPALPSCCKDLR